jgi:Fe-S-cluster containining protein
MRSLPPSLDPAQELSRIYDALGRLFDGASCPRSTRCCRFRETGKVPYLWPIEAERIRRAVARRGGKLPYGGGPEQCPLLARDGACSVYDDRPFGCRTFFCGDATLPFGRRRAEVDEQARRLRDLSYALGDAELLPLTTQL